LTRERFVPNPFVQEPGARIYRTGDLVQRRADGMIQFLGRMDHQVKVRGFRIELGEIEVVLRQHAGVQACVVVAQHDASGDTRLVAYIVGSRGALSISESRQHLRSKLPEYMIPAAFVALDKLPLTPTSKVDRKALPALREQTGGSGKESDTPSTPTEKKLVGIWRELLGIDRVGIRDNFFDLGGHSLLTIRLQSRIENVFGIRIPLAELFRQPKIDGIATFLDSASSADGQLREEQSDVPSPQRKVDWASLSAVKATGRRPPLIEVNVAYNAVERYLPEDQPYYLLQTATVLDERIPPYYPATGVGDIAVRYLEVLRAFQPSGPYYLLGWCFGGRIAYEMAQRLLDEGEQVAFLGVIDWLPFSASRGHRLADRWRQFNTLGPRAKINLLWTLLMSKMRWVLSTPYRVGSPLCNVTNSAIRRLLGIPLSPNLLRWRHSRTVNRFAKEHEVEKYPGRLTLFYCAEESFGRSKLWEGVAAKVETFEIPGNHLTMVQEPNVRILAKALEESLARARSQANFQDAPVDFCNQETAKAKVESSA